MSREHKGHQTQISISHSEIADQAQEKINHHFEMAQKLKEIGFDGASNDYLARAMNLAARSQVTVAAHGEQVQIDIVKGEDESGHKIHTVKAIATNLPSSYPKEVLGDTRTTGVEIVEGVQEKFHRLVNGTARHIARDAFRKSGGISGKPFSLIDTMAEQIENSLKEQASQATFDHASKHFEHQQIGSEEINLAINYAIQEESLIHQEVASRYQTHVDSDGIKWTTYVEPPLPTHIPSLQETFLDGQTNALAMGENVITHTETTFWDRLLGGK